MNTFSWAAGKDGIAHAAKPGHSRALCGAKTQDARWTWPAESRCTDCQAIETWPAIRRVGHFRALLRKGEPVNRQPKSESWTYTPEGRVLITPKPGATYEFASRASLEDYLSVAYSDGLRAGYQAGVNHATTTGTITEVSTLLRGEDGRLAGLVKRNVATIAKGATR